MAADEWDRGMWVGSLLLCKHGLRKQPYGIIGPPFLAMKLFLCLYGQLLFDNLMSGVRNLHSMAARVLNCVKF